MHEILKISLYIIGIIIASMILWFVDFNKFIRTGKKEYAIIVYIVLSIVLGFLIGKFFIEIGVLFRQTIIK